MSTQKVKINSHEIILIKSENSNTALLCTPYKCVSGITVNYINIKEFEKNDTQKTIKQNGFSISIYSISTEKQLIVTSPLATQGLDTIFFEKEDCRSICTTWATIERENSLCK